MTDTQTAHEALLEEVEVGLRRSYGPMGNNTIRALRTAIKSGELARSQIFECEIYLKEGETPRQRMDRDQRDILGLMDLLRIEKERVKALQSRTEQEPVGSPEWLVSALVSKSISATQTSYGHRAARVFADSQDAAIGWATEKWVIDGFALESICAEPLTIRTEQEPVTISEDQVIALMRRYFGATTYRLNTREKSVPLLPQETYDVPTFEFMAFARSIAALYTSPPDQSARIAELEAEIAALHNKLKEK